MHAQVHDSALYNTQVHNLNAAVMHDTLEELPEAPCSKKAAHVSHYNSRHAQVPDGALHFKTAHAAHDVIAALMPNITEEPPEAPCSKRAAEIYSTAPCMH